MLKMKLDLQFFASGTLTGNVKTSSSGTKLQMKLEWSSVENVSANTSTITTKLYGKRADSLTGATSGKNWGGKVQVGSNTAHSFSSMSSSTSVSTSWVLFKTYTDTITHNADGTKSVTITASLNGCSGTSLAGLTSSASGTATLGTIPRGSILGDIEDFNIDDTITIPITKNVETYTDNLVISCGETTIKTIDPIVDGAEVSFTEEEKSVIQSLMTSPSIDLTFTLTSLNGSEIVGTSIKTASMKSFSNPIAYNIRKKDNGYYKMAINGLVDDEIDNPLQVYDDEGIDVFGAFYNGIGNTASVNASHYVTIGDLLICFGKVEVPSTANTITNKAVTFPKNFLNPPVITITAMSSVPYSTERGGGTGGVTVSGFTLYHIRTNTTATVYFWMAIGKKGE